MKLGIVPYQEEDFIVEKGSLRPSFPQYQPTYDNFNKPHDIPLNKRHFIYSPCAPITAFKELGYCNTEYPFENPGFNTMDRSDGLSLIENSNDTVGVIPSMGWKTGRCDVCIKEGVSYWEIEVIKGGTVSLPSEEDDILKRREKIDTSPHLRFGISRRETSLEAPVGFDSYGYGIRDQSLESVHEGKLRKILQDGKILKPGDRLGFILELPKIDKQIEQAKEYTARRLDGLNQSIYTLQGTYNTDFSNEDTSNHSGGPLKKKSKHSKTSNKEFEKALLEDIDYTNIFRDQIAIRYKGQLFFEGTDYIKTTKPEYYSSDRRERQDYYSLEGSSLKVYLNGEYLGKSFENIDPFLPPFSELQYNEKFYYGYWKNGELNQVEANFRSNSFNQNETEENKPQETLVGRHGSNVSNGKQKRLLLRNKYVNNNKLGYYPTVSCFNGGEAKIITVKKNLKYFEEVKKAEITESEIKTLDVLFQEQIAEDLVWDIIDEVEEECKNKHKKK